MITRSSFAFAVVTSATDGDGGANGAVGGDGESSDGDPSPRSRVKGVTASPGAAARVVWNSISATASVSTLASCGRKWSGCGSRSTGLATATKNGISTPTRWRPVLNCDGSDLVFQSRFSCFFHLKIFTSPLIDGARASAMRKSASVAKYGPFVVASNSSCRFIVELANESREEVGEPLPETSRCIARATDERRPSTSPDSKSPLYSSPSSSSVGSVVVSSRAPGVLGGGCTAPTPMFRGDAYVVASFPTRTVATCAAAVRDIASCRFLASGVSTALLDSIPSERRKS